MPPPFGNTVWDPHDAPDIRSMIYMGAGPQGITGRSWDDYQANRARAGLPGIFTPNTMGGPPEALRAGFFMDPSTMTEWYAKPWALPDGLWGAPGEQDIRQAMMSAHQDQFLFDYARRVGAYAPEARQVRFPISNVGPAAWPGLMTQRYSPIRGSINDIRRELGFHPNLVQYPESQLVGLGFLANIGDQSPDNTPAIRVGPSTPQDFGGKRQILAPVLADPTMALYRSWDGALDDPAYRATLRQRTITPATLDWIGQQSVPVDHWAFNTPLDWATPQERYDAIKTALQMPTNIPEPELQGMADRYLGGDTRRTFMDQWRQYGNAYTRLYPALLPLLLGAAGALIPQRAEAAIGRGVSSAEQAMGVPSGTASNVMNAASSAFDFPLAAIMSAAMGAPPQGSTQILRYPNSPADRAAAWMADRASNLAFPPPPAPARQPRGSIYETPQWSVPTR